MDFFKHQEMARSESSKLLVIFILGIILVIAFTIVLILPLFYYVFQVPVFQLIDYTNQVDYYHLTEIGFKILKSVSLFVTFTVGGGVLFKLMVLSNGGKSIASMLGGVPLAKSALSPELRQLIQNVNEEMALASGIRPPPIYIIFDKSINALAAGMEIRDSVICLTEGTAKELNRDELSAVIAHEMGHILGSDVRTNMYLASIIHGLAMFSIIGHLLMRHSDTFRSRSNLFLLILGFFFFFVAGVIGSAVAGLIQSFYSQEREYLADACAVQFTRSKEGILGVFQKIWWKRFRNTLRSPYAVEVAHFMFTSSIKKQDGSTSTHPTLKDRARRVDPTFRFKKFPPENFESKNVHTIIEKQSPKPSQIPAGGGGEYLDCLLKSTSFGANLNFSLQTFAVMAMSEGQFNKTKSDLYRALEKPSHESLKFRYWLALYALDAERSITEAGKRVRRSRIYKNTHPLTYFEMEIVIVFSAFIGFTNSDNSARLRAHFKKVFPWCRDLIEVKTITMESFFSSLEKLGALNTDSKKVIYDFIKEVIHWDSRVSFEEEEFFKFFCERLNMPMPLGAR